MGIEEGESRKKGAGSREKKTEQGLSGSRNGKITIPSGKGADKAVEGVLRKKP